MINVLGNQNSIINQYIAELRDEVIQKDSARFRKNLSRIGYIVAYEISKMLEYKEIEVTTPLGIAKVPVLKSQVVLATILRAGLPLHNGMLEVFDRAENAFISAYRKYHKDGTFDIRIEYMSCPILTDKILLISDPMLATGKSIVLTYKSMLENGKPKHTHIISVLASVEGIEYVKKTLSSDDVTVWVGAVDEELTAQAYIVPGLGDAGDLAYGEKSDVH